MGFLCLLWATYAQVQMPDLTESPKRRELAIVASHFSEAILADKFIAELVRRKDLESKWNIQGLALLSNKPQAIEDWLKTTTADAVILLGVRPTSAAFELESTPPVPVIAGFFHDPSLFNVYFDDLGRSGKQAFTFSIPGHRLTRDLNHLKDLTGAGHFAVALEAELFEVFPELEVKLSKMAKELALELQVLKVGNTVAELGRRLDSGVKGVLVGPLAHLRAGEKQKLFTQLQDKKLPSFSMTGMSGDTSLVFATALENPDLTLAKKLVDHLEAFSYGEALSQRPAYLALTERLIINGGVAHGIGFQPSLETKIQADVRFGDQRSSAKELGLNDIIAIGLRSNLDLQAGKMAVLSADYQAKAAQSQLLPQVNALAQQSANNKDNPLIRAGLSPESQTTWSLNASQVLFDERVIANAKTARLEARKQRAAFSNQFDGHILEIANAFLGLGTNQSLLDIEIENLKRTRSNLNIAKSRVALGVVGRDETLRWESLYAQQLADVHLAASKVEVSRSQLALLCSSKLPEEWEFKQAKLQGEDTLFLSEQWEELLQEYPTHVLELLNQNALQKSPQLKIAELNMAIARRQKAQAKRSFFLPKITLGANLNDVIDQEFQRSQNNAGPSFSLEQDRQNWNVTLTASLPLFSGGRRIQQLGQAKAVYGQTKVRHAAGVLRIRENIRISLALVTASGPNVGLAEQAAESARKNWQIIESRYEQGQVSILDILQAQEQALAADRQASIAHYSHVANLYQLMYAASLFDWNWSPQARAVWLEEAKARLEKGEDVP